MRRVRTSLTILCAGVATFGLVFALLQVTRSEAAPSQGLSTPPAAPAAGSLPHSTNPLVARMVAGDVAIGVPVTGSALLLRDVQPGDRLDVSASLPSPVDGRPVTAVIVRGATVLQPGSGGDPLLLEVPASEAIALAHLVLGGTRLGFIVWPVSGSSPPASSPLDERSARSLLGLMPTANRLDPTVPPTESPPLDPLSIPPGALPPLAQPALAPTAPTAESAMSPRTTGFLYQTQERDTWDSIASIFGVSVAELKRWNEVAAGQDPAPQSLVFIPR